MTITEATPHWTAHMQPEQIAVDSLESSPAPARPVAPQRAHSYVPRGLGYVPESRLTTGLFGRMFRELEPFVADAEQIAAIAELMREPTPAEPLGDNTRVPAGYTYLGQFIDHDITFDPISSLERQNDPDALTNFRTPRFDLDCVYGRGPAAQPYLYDQARPGHLAIGRHGDELDLPRDEQEVALIGDPRNDENVFISQIHLTMLLFHNKVVDWLAGNGQYIRTGEDAFTAAQRIVRWHYQWLVIHDFLRRLVEPATFDVVLVTRPMVPGGLPVEQVHLRFFGWAQQIFMPLEFAVAAYRLERSMVRQKYKLNSTLPRMPISAPDPANADPHTHFGGFRRLPEQWQIEMTRFFPIDGRPATDLQSSRRIGRHLAPAVHHLSTEQAATIHDLAVRNLTRGAQLGLPSGQAVAGIMGLAPLSDTQLGLPAAGPAPLWYYILREAEMLANGQHLGPVGSRIVTETFCGMLSADSSSYLRSEPGWKPFLPARTPGDFTMGDLIAFADFGLPTN
jgi:hypothetical protein